MNVVLKLSTIDTPLGPMIAIGDENTLYLLEFGDRKSLGQQMEALKQQKPVEILSGMSASIESIREELTLYFQGRLKSF